MRSPLRLLVLALLATGCAAKSVSPTPLPGGMVPSNLRSPESPATEAAPRVMWAVRTFDEKPGWLDGQAALASLPAGTFGERMAVAVSKALDARRVNSQVVPKDVTTAQMDALYANGLQYFCEGTLSSVAVAKDGNATLRVAYRLKRHVNGETRTVQARSIEGSLPFKALDEPAMQALIDSTAGKIADAVVADVPADLLAIRG